MSPNQRNQNKQKYVVCISNTPSPTLLLTDALWNKEGALLAAQRLTANHVIVIPASWPIMCLSCSGFPPPLPSPHCYKFSWLWTREERFTKVTTRKRGMTGVWRGWQNAAVFTLWRIEELWNHFHEERVTIRQRNDTVGTVKSADGYHEIHQPGYAVKTSLLMTYSVMNWSYFSSSKGVFVCCGFK